MADNDDDGNDLVGYVSVEQQGETGWLSYFVREAHWGRGYGTEAARAVVRWGMDELDLQAVAAMTLASNPRSERLLLKIGMALVREAATTIGGRADVWRYYAVARAGRDPVAAIPR